MMGLKFKVEANIKLAKNKEEKNNEQDNIRPEQLPNKKPEL